MQEPREKIRAFIRDSFLFGDGELVDADSFLELGIIDSTGVLELVAFLEDEWHLTIEDAELVPDNLDSVDLIVQFLDRKRSAVAT
jgi:acyl carrier protein